MALAFDTFPAIVISTIVIFVAWFAQYLLLAGGAWYAVWIAGRERFAAHRVQRKPRRAARPLRELWLSTISIAIFAILLAFTGWLAGTGWTRVYDDVAEYGWTWWCASVVVMAIVHDSYYYFAHRAMHHPAVFRHVHKVHHEFAQPTPFASYAFHPLEAIVEVAWFLPLALVIPVHPGAVAVYIVVLTALNVISHLGYEFYDPRISRWFITSTHHNLHHSRGRGHFMLYFNLWDRWLGSNHDDYEGLIAQIDERVRDARGKRREGDGKGEVVAIS